MSRIRISDVFSIATTCGQAFIQYAAKSPDMGELVRVLPGLYVDQPNDLRSLIMQREIFVVHYPLRAAFSKGVANRVGTIDLPVDFEVPRYMREPHIGPNGEKVGWHIVDVNTWHRRLVSELSPQEVKLSPWGIWNDTLLSQRIAEGWSLERWT